MAELNLGNATTVGLSGIPNFIMEAMALDAENDNGETTHYFTEATKNLGYYAHDPIVNASANGMATWAFGRGVEYEDPKTKAEFEHFSGRGNDTFQTLMWNHEVMKLVVGDAFMEIVRAKTGDLILNLIPISAERIGIVSENGRIKRYVVWDGKKWKKIKFDNMYHTSNKRIGDQIHGTSQIDALRKTIDARQEAEADERVIKHRDKAIGICKYKTNNQGKILTANAQIKKAIEDGDMVGVSDETVDFEPFPVKSSEDRQNWIASRENFAYATFGIPRNMITSDGTSEVGGINGHLIFEQAYGKEQSDEEAAIWNQLARKVKFNRPPSLAPKVQENQAANTGTTQIQPSEVTPSVNR